jgi:septum formation topological specificity factor MinE
MAQTKKRKGHTDALDRRQAKLAQRKEAQAQHSSLLRILQGHTPVDPNGVAIDMQENDLQIMPRNAVVEVPVVEIVPGQVIKRSPA